MADLCEIAQLLKGPQTASVRLRQGVLASSPSGGRVNLRLSGSDVVITGVRYMKGISIASGDTVWIVTDGRDLFVLGALQPVT